MVEREESVVAVAQVVGAEVYAGAVACGADHQFQHHFGHVKLCPPRRWVVPLMLLLPILSLSFLLGGSGAISLSLITVVFVWWIRGSCGIVRVAAVAAVVSIAGVDHSLITPNLVKVLCHSMLATVLILRLP